MANTKVSALTLVVGFVGAALAVLAGVPVGALIGSTVAVVALTATGRPVGVPTGLRYLAFACIGVSLGSGVDERIFGQIEI